MTNAHCGYTVLDGGMGRLLERLGAPFRLPEWSALSLIEAPEFVMRAHEAYVESGAEIITTNSYGLVPHMIGEQRFEAESLALADRAGRIAREVADRAPHKVLVAGSLPPLFESYRPGNFIAEQAPRILTRLVEGLAPYVDVWLIETQSSTIEALTALAAVRETGLPIYVSYTLKDEDGRIGPPELRSGEAVADAVAVTLEAGASAILFNCSQPEVMSEAILTARRVVDASANRLAGLGVYANAFLPEPPSDEPYAGISEIRADLDPENYLKWVRRWADQGATIVGGCCGIGPEHIKAISANRKTVHASALQLPIVDLSQFHASAESRAKFVDDLRRILHDHGFFYLVGHGVAPQLIADVLAVSKRFFALPEKDKLEIEMVNSPHFRGYNRAGLEHTRGKQDWREQVDVNTEAEAVTIGPDTPAWKRLIGPNQWPSALPELKPLLLSYQAEVTRVGIDILKAIAIALGQDETVFADLYEPQPTQLLKIVRYPGRDVAQSEQGVGAHKDGGLVTVLLQDSTPGLRVRTEDGVWLDAPPLNGSFVINTGELLELATNGFVRADVHDVVAPPAGSERYSVPFFLGARFDAVVPLINLPEDLNSRERGVTVDPLNPIFREVGQNNLKSRLRSHPDVAQRHHKDLIQS